MGKAQEKNCDTFGCFVVPIVRGAFRCQVAICPPERQPEGEIVFMMVTIRIITRVIKHDKKKKQIWRFCKDRKKQFITKDNFGAE